MREQIPQTSFQISWNEWRHGTYDKGCHRFTCEGWQYRPIPRDEDGNIDLGGVMLLHLHHL